MSVRLCLYRINKHLIQYCRDLYLPGFSDHISTRLECWIFSWWMKTEVLWWIDQHLLVVSSQGMESCAVSYYSIITVVVGRTLLWMFVWSDGHMAMNTRHCHGWLCGMAVVVTRDWVRATWQDSHSAVGDNSVDNGAHLKWIYCVFVIDDLVVSLIRARCQVVVREEMAVIWGS